MRLTPGCVHVEQDIDEAIRECSDLHCDKTENISKIFCKSTIYEDRLTVMSDKSAATVVNRPVFSVKRISLFITVSDLTSARPFRMVSLVRNGDIDVPPKPSSIPIQQETQNESDTKIRSRSKRVDCTG